jgi:transcriptional regulator with XRE-family HTH domain
VPEDIKKVVGQNIQRLRKKKGWSQEKLGEMADLHRTYIGQVERGEKSIGVENLALIAKTLGVRTGALVADI